MLPSFQNSIVDDDDDYSDHLLDEIGDDDNDDFLPSTDELYCQPSRA